MYAMISKLVASISSTGCQLLRLVLLIVMIMMMVVVVVIQRVVGSQFTKVLIHSAVLYAIISSLSIPYTDTHSTCSLISPIYIRSCTCQRKKRYAQRV